MYICVGRSQNAVLYIKHEAGNSNLTVVFQNKAHNIEINVSVVLAGGDINSFWKSGLYLNWTLYIFSKMGKKNNNNNLYIYIYIYIYIYAEYFCEAIWRNSYSR